MEDEDGYFGKDVAARYDEASAAMFEPGVVAAAVGLLAGLAAAGRGAFSALITDASPHVRCRVAAQLLALGDERGVPLLEAAEIAGGLQGLAAGTVLQEWMAGRLAPPFGSQGWASPPGRTRGGSAGPCS